jgi:colanic acid biosynthesis glycosyl transferase WcaI
MRLLLLTLNYSPELTGIGKFSGEMAEWLAARGHEVRVITTPPYYPEWQVHDGYSTLLYRREKLSNVDVTRCPLWVPKRQSGSRRILSLLSFAVSSAPATFAAAISFRPDIIGVVKPPMFALPTALLASWLTGATSWVHVQDFEIDVAFDMGLLKGRRLAAGALAFENAVLGKFDFATTISPRMRDRLTLKGIFRNRTKLFQNWVDVEAIYPCNRYTEVRAQLQIPDDAIVALYAGNMGEKQGLDTLIEVGREIADNSRIILVIAGEGAERARLKEKADGLANISFLPLQPLERLNDLLNTADIHLLPQREDAADLVMPSKLGGMLASGRPVIAGAHQGTQLASEVDGVGIVVPPDNGHAMAMAIRNLAANTDLRQELGKAARARAIERWSRESILAKWEKNLLALVQEKKQSH